MDWDKLKLTKLDNEILEFLFRNPTTSFMGKEIADKIEVSQTAVSKSVKRLVKIGLVKKEKKIVLSIKLNRDDKDIFELKRLYNIKSLYASGLMQSLFAVFPGSTVVLFGSYSNGDDTENSDIDIAVMGYKKSNLGWKKFENRLNRTIQLHFFSNLKNIDKHLKESIINGITLKGAITP